MQLFHPALKTVCRRPGNAIEVVGAQVESTLKQQSWLK